MGFIAPPDDVIDQRNVVMHVGAEIKQHYEPMHHLPNINASQSISAAGGGMFFQFCAFTNACTESTFKEICCTCRT